MNGPTRTTVLDERFFDRRRSSTSIAGSAGGVLACALFVYRHYADRVWNWDVLAVAMAIAAIKIGLMAWYHFTD